MNRRLQVAKYVLADLVGSAVAWTLFFLYRKMYLDSVNVPFNELTFETNYFLGLVLIPLFWFGLYTIVGGYREIFRRFRIKELGQTLLITFLGVTVIFFVLLLDDDVVGYTFYYRSYLALLLFHFFCTFIPRFILTSTTVRKVHNRQIAFNTILIGGNELAMTTYEEIEGLPKSPGNKFVGFVNVNGGDQLLTEVGLPRLGKWNELRTIIDQHEVEEAIIAVDSGEHAHISKIMNELDGTHVRIKIIPDMYDILAGSVKMSSIFGAPLIEVNPEIMPAWQFSLKRAIDISVSALALIILSPLYLIIGICVWSTSHGPMFFRQERIGKYGRPFNIVKFRSMVSNAEELGPQLSSSTDVRITPFGRWMRKTRMDELPQFWNVLKGDMSLVGPRPERQHFIDAIMEKAPHYKHLHKVRPGITSWGQVKFGYAENVDQMVRRLKYDILYIENMSLAVDLKILAYTVIIVLKGDGK